MSKAKEVISVQPMFIREVNEFIEKHHRHHKRVTGHRFSLGVFEGVSLIGVISVGRPVARATDQRLVAEVTRLCVLPEYANRHLCSMLYARVARIAKEMGFRSIQTFILESEPGTSLKACGWDCLGVVRKYGKGWNNREGRRTDQPVSAKTKWEKVLNR